MAFELLEIFLGEDIFYEVIIFGTFLLVLRLTKYLSNI